MKELDFGWPWGWGHVEGAVEVLASRMYLVARYMFWIADLDCGFLWHFRYFRDLLVAGQFCRMDGLRSDLLRLALAFQGALLWRFSGMYLVVR